MGSRALSTMRLRAPGDSGTVPAMHAYAAGGLSLLIPGLGQLARRRVGDAVLFAFLTLWLMLTLSASAQMMPRGLEADPVWAALVGFPAFPRGGMRPIAVVATVAVVGVHLWSAWDAWRDAR